MWMECNQNGAFRTQSRDSFYYLKNEVLTLKDFFEPQCLRVFGVEPNYDITQVNIDTGGLNVHGRNIVFVFGNEDPWQWLGRTVIKSELNQHLIYMICEYGCSHTSMTKTVTDDDADILVQSRVEVMRLAMEQLGIDYLPEYQGESSVDMDVDADVDAASTSDMDLNKPDIDDTKLIKRI